MHMSSSEELTKVLADEVRTFGLVYEGTDDERARAHLIGYCAVLKSLLSQSIGVAQATLIVEAFERAVLTRKLELEVRAAMARAMPVTHATAGPTRH
jgi:hypothetical protein